MADERKNGQVGCVSETDWDDGDWGKGLAQEVPAPGPIYEPQSIEEAMGLTSTAPHINCP